MSLYQTVSITDRIKQLKTPLIILLGLIILAILVLMLINLLKPQSIDARFDKNPLLIGEDFSTTLSITLTNITETDAKNTEVKVFPRDSERLHVFPETMNYGTLGAGEYKKENFRIQPNPKYGSEISEGKYLLDINAKINNIVFTKTVSLEVKKK